MEFACVHALVCSHLILQLLLNLPILTFIHMFFQEICCYYFSISLAQSVRIAIVSMNLVPVSALYNFWCSSFELISGIKCDL